jgi:serine protease Do
MAVAVASLLVGLLMASSLPGTGASAAQDRRQNGQLSTTASTLPGSFAELAERLSPTVVNVQVTKVAQMGAFPLPEGPEGPSGEFFRRFFQDTPHRPEPHRMHGSGSGVIISHDGYILTNHHVVDGAQEVTVTMADQQVYKARVVGRDPKTDLAILKIEAKEPLPTASMSDSDQLKVGDWVLAIGNPFGLSHSVTAGIVSAKGRVIGAGPYDDFIQTDAPINPGNSGGPLFNMQGEMVGINTAIVSSGQGIGFAIPINIAKPLIPQLERTGEVTRGYLGVSIQSISAELAKAFKLEDRQGALVAEVVPGSPAARAGIRQGDVIVAFNGKAVKDAHDLPPMAAETPVGQKVTVTVRRDGVTQQLPITVGKLPSEQAAREESAQPAQSQWGLRLQDVTPQAASRLGLTTDHGVMVVGVQPGSPAEQAGLREGDLILEVNHQPVHSGKEVREALAKAHDEASLLLLVKRDNGSIFVALAK